MSQLWFLLRDMLDWGGKSADPLFEKGAQDGRLVVGDVVSAVDELCVLDLFDLLAVSDCLSVNYDILE